MLDLRTVDPADDERLIAAVVAARESVDGRQWRIPQEDA